MRKTVGLTLSVVIILLISLHTQPARITAFAQGGETFGDCLVWRFFGESGKLVIYAGSTDAAIPDFCSFESHIQPCELSPWHYLSNSITEVVVEDGITAVGNNAFSDLINATSAVIPDSVTSIGDGAFMNCVSLENIRFPRSLCYIGAYAFGGCKSLKSLEIPDNTRTIGTCAFCGCVGLEHITVDKGNAVYRSAGNCLINKIKASVVTGCGNSVLPTDGSVKSIDPYAFFGCETLKSICLSGADIKDFVIGEYAFSGCTALKDVYFFGSRSEAESLLNYGTAGNNLPFKIAVFHYCGYSDASQNAWYSNALSYTLTSGLMIGYGNGRFGVSDRLTRQDAVVILARMSGCDISAYSGVSPFKDVASNCYYAASVAWGKQTAIVNGYNSLIFGTGDKVTREQFVCFLYRYASLMGADISLNKDKSYYLSKYSDYSSVSPYAVDAVCWALDRGIISGRTSNTIAPKGTASRCEIAQILYNIFDRGVFQG